MTRFAPPVTRRTSLALTAFAASSLLLALSSPAEATGTPISGSGTGSIVAEAAASPIGLVATARPTDLVFSQDGATAYASAGTTKTISVIDVATNSETATVTLLTEPRGLAASRDGDWLYAADFAMELVKIDTATLVATVLPASAQFSAVAVSADGTKVYGVSATTVEVMSAATGTTITSIAAGFTGGYSIVMSPDGSRVYAGSIGDNKIVAIDTATDAVIATITTAGAYPTSLGFSPDGSTLYATAQLDDAMSIIDTATNTVTTSGVPAGTHPSRIAISPNGLFAYVADSLTDAMTIIDLATNSTTAALSTGLSPTGIAVSPDGTRIFVADYDSNEVTAFDVTRLAFTGQDSVAPGSDATFALALTNGASPVANYTAGSAKVELLDAADAVVATGAPVPPDAGGLANVIVSTVGLPVGAYSVRVTFTDASGVVVARAAGFSIGGLAATGADSGPIVVLGVLLLVAGLVIILARPRDRHRGRASGSRISR